MNERKEQEIGVNVFGRIEISSVGVFVNGDSLGGLVHSALMGALGMDTEEFQSKVVIGDVSLVITGIDPQDAITVTVTEGEKNENNEN